MLIDSLFGQSSLHVKYSNLVVYSRIVKIFLWFVFASIVVNAFLGIHECQNFFCFIFRSVYYFFSNYVLIACTNYDEPLFFYCGVLFFLTTFLSFFFLSYLGLYGVFYLNLFSIGLF
jgi:hypothetical protein